MQYSYSQRLSLTAFLNALLNEWHGYHKTENEIAIASEAGELVLPLLRDSLVKRFSFDFPARLRHQGISVALSYEQVVEFICEHPTIVGQYNETQITAFKQQVLASEQHMAGVSEHRQGEWRIDSFIKAEQGLVGGHNLHPAGKTRQGWDDEQASVYSPDYANEFALHWYFIKPELIAGEFAGEYAGDSATETDEGGLAALLIQSYQDANIGIDIPSGFLPYPVHPHQAAVLDQNTSVQQYLADGLLVALNAQGKPWRATSSTRALWQAGSEWMLKFSLAVKLTNSIRHLSPTELSRGVLFQQVHNELAGAEFAQRFPDFTILQEPAWCGIKDLAGEYITDSLFCWRENPFKTGDEACLTLATMTQEQPDGSNHIAELVKRHADEQSISLADSSAVWFEHFLEQVIKPVVVARSDYGLVMLAHQQNLLVSLDKNLPSGGVFRDCQGTGYTETALTRFTLFSENQPAYFADNANLNPYFGYYIILNSLNSVIAALSSNLSLNESKQLLTVATRFWQKLRAESYYDTSFYDYILQSDYLKIKGNFFCFLGVSNETDLSDPSKIYQDYSNPYKSKEQTEQAYFYKSLFPNETNKLLGLALTFSQEKQFSNKLIGFSVASSSHSWRFTCRQDNTGSHHLSLQMAEGVASSADTLPTMSEAQWFNVIEHAFLGFSDDCTIVQIPLLEWQSITQITQPSWAALVAGQIVINRSDFFQYAGIWSNANDHLTDSETLIIAESGIEHPVRPPQPKGVWFHKFVYPLKRTIQLRCADVDRDTAVFSHWHNQPEIYRMWELQGAFSEHKTYLEKQTQSPYSQAVIGYYDGLPFGYFEVYWTPEDRLGPYYDCQHYDRGVHMLVGSPFFLGGVHFTCWASAVEHAIFVDEQRTNHIMGEPRADNHHVAKITKTIGMKKLKEFDFPHKRSALLCCTRETFFNTVI